MLTTHTHHNHPHMYLQYGSHAELQRLDILYYICVKSATNIIQHTHAPYNMVSTCIVK